MLIHLRRRFKKIIFQSRLFSRQNFGLSAYQAPKFTNFILDGVETGTFVLDFAQQLRRKNADLPDIYFIFLTPLAFLRLWFWIKMPKLKREEVGSFSKLDRQKPQKLYTQGGVAYGSVRN